MTRGALEFSYESLPPRHRRCASTNLSHGPSELMSERQTVEPTDAERAGYEAQLTHLTHSEERDASSSTRYLTIAHGGLAVSLAAWLQSCFSVEASQAQHAMVLPIVYALCFAMGGFAVAILIPLIRMLGGISTARLVLVRSQLGGRAVRLQSDAEGRKAVVISARSGTTPQMERRQTRFALSWGVVWYGSTVASWLLFVVALTVIVFGTLEATEFLN